MSYMELYSIISKPWASINEIKLIANCGRDTAIKIRNQIQEKISKSGKQLPKSKTIIVPMKNVLDYLHLDYDYIINMAINERKVFQESNIRTNKHASISK